MRIKEEFTKVQIEQLASEMLASKTVLNQAMQSARAKTIRWIQTAVMRALRIESKLPSAVLKRRIVISRKGKKGTVFIGLKPIPVARLSPKQTSKGVKAKGGVDLPGAFVIEGLEHVAVFQRVKQTAYPIEYLRVFIDEDAERIIQGDVMPLVPDKFYQYLEAELKWRTVYKRGLAERRKSR